MIKNRRAFTFIEMIVVVGVIALVLPIVFGILFAIMQQQIKIYKLTEAKRQGDYALNAMETTIRNNAISTHTVSPAISGITDGGNEVCKDTTSSATNFSYFMDKTDNAKWFGYVPDTTATKISSDSANVASKGDLTTSKVRVENFTLTCMRSSSYSSPIISVSFNICYNNGVPCSTAARSEEMTKLTYSTSIILRNQ